jgi:hypothetical protein
MTKPLALLLREVERTRFETFGSSECRPSPSPNQLLDATCDSPDDRQCVESKDNTVHAAAATYGHGTGNWPCRRADIVRAKNPNKAGTVRSSLATESCAMASMGNLLPSIVYILGYYSNPILATFSLLWRRAPCFFGSQRLRLVPTLAHHELDQSAKTEAGRALAAIGMPVVVVLHARDV